MAERGGFEPPIHFCIHDFQSWALSHSAIFPIIFIIPEIKKNKDKILQIYIFFIILLFFLSFKMIN
jgi:hypothetical protein